MFRSCRRIQASLRICSFPLKLLASLILILIILQLEITIRLEKLSTNPPQNSRTFNDIGDPDKSDKPIATSLKSTLICTEGCTIYDMNPWELSIAHFFRQRRKTRHWQCPPSLTILLANQTLKYNVEHPNFEDFTCCFRGLYRITMDPDNYTKYADATMGISSACQPISLQGTKMNTESIRVECNRTVNDYDEDANKPDVIEEYHVNPRSPFRRSKRTKVKALYWKNRTKDSVSSPPLNVFILGINSVSRLHMIRSLPATRRFFEENDFLEMKGFTSIGEDSFSNRMALLTGLTGGKEEQYECWPSPNSKLDRCPFIWKNFSRQHYITGLVEDVPRRAALNRGKPGFVEQPTDYYLRPLFMAKELTISQGHQLKQVGYGAGDVRNCIGGKTSTDFLLGYLQSSLIKIQKSGCPFFFLSWLNAVSRNPGTTNLLKQLDLTLETFFKSHLHRHANQTVLIVLSDHGFREGKVRATTAGHYESSLPFLYIRIPPSLKESQPQLYKNLQENSGKLTSPLDVHATLEELSHFDTNFFDEFRYFPKNFRRAYSLFERAPANRNCESAGIPENNCRCGFNPTQSLTGEMLGRKTHLYGHFVINLVNEVLAQEITKGICVPLKFSRYLYFTELYDDKKPEGKIYLVGLEAHPGGAEFEMKLQESQNASLCALGDVTRINSYNERQTNCVDSIWLKRFCTCNDVSRNANRKRRK